MRSCNIYVDFGKKDNWDFPKVVSHQTGIECKVIAVKTNHLHGSSIKSFLRIVMYFLYPLKWILSREECCCRIAWQQFFGINMAFYMRLFRLRKKAPLIVMTFIYNEKRGLLGRLYYQYVKYAISSDYIDRIIVFSSREVAIYSNLFNVDKFVYIPLGIDPVSTSEEAYINRSVVFATGRSNRDWDFLINCMSGSKYNLRIATDTLKHKYIGENVTLLENCFGDDMINEMNSSFCVAIPLKDTEVSAGQLVILQAMCLGKPVIATKGSATLDYVADGITGFLVNNKSEFMKALERLQDESTYIRLSENASMLFKSRHSLYSMGCQCADVIKSLNCL